MLSIPDEIAAYLRELKAAAPSLGDIWLLGSRANGIATETSDWDFLVFGSADALTRLRALPEGRSDMDVLIVTDEDKFESPWPRKNNPLQYKSGRLVPGFEYDDKLGLEQYSDNWKWKEISTTEAEYLGMKNGERRPGMKAFRVIL